MILGKVLVPQEGTLAAVALQNFNLQNHLPLLTLLLFPIQDSRDSGSDKTPRRSTMHHHRQIIRSLGKYHPCPVIMNPMIRIINDQSDNDLVIGPYQIHPFFAGWWNKFIPTRVTKS